MSLLCDESLIPRLPLPLAQLYRRAHIFFFVLTLDENYNLVTVDTRVQIGWFIIVLIILMVLMSVILVVYPAIRGITKLFASKKK